MQYTVAKTCHQSAIFSRINPKIQWVHPTAVVHKDHKITGNVLRNPTNRQTDGRTSAKTSPRWWC